jgi:glycosyltransferase involved in cell wall biosynthesis
MEFKPFFSVVISTKNRAKLVLNAIESVFNQTFKNFELIVVDNASTDTTHIELSKIKDVRFTYLRNDLDRERCFARNRGVLASKGEYVCFLDSDDEYLPNHLEVIFNFIQNSELKQALFFTNAYETYNFDDLQERVCPDLDNYNLFEYILTYTFNPARVAIHNSIIAEFQYDEKIPGLEDLDLWLRIATKFPVLQIKERTIIYQIHDESYSISAPKRFERELFLFNYVFSKPILNGYLPVRAKKRLLSMCHYKISMAMSTTFKPFIVHYHILKAFLYFPKGYNKKANKTMFVIFFFQIPLFGFILKKTISFLKSIRSNQKF